MSRTAHFGRGVYQPPFPGMEAPAFPAKGHETVPVGDVFPHPQIEKSNHEYRLVSQYNPKTARVKTSALRPTQGIVDQGTLHAPNHDQQAPGVIKDTKGRYRIVDGHHRIANALINGEKHVNVLLWNERAR